jgi:hypothetical protein
LGSDPSKSSFKSSLGSDPIPCSTTDRYSKTTYRDAQGRIQGSKK